MEESESAPEARIAFVAWDTTAFALKDDILPALALRSVPGWRILIGGVRRHTRDLWSEVEADLERAHRVVALLDQPNANVGFELGQALALGKEVVLGFVGLERAKWTERAPLDGFVKQRASSAAEIVELLTSVDAHEVTSHPDAGDGTLFLCPVAAPGRDYREALAERRVEQPHWRLLDNGGGRWNLLDLPVKLASVRRLVWVVLPFEPGTDQRDGGENAAHSILAGYWKGLGRELVVLRHGKARDIVDVARGARDFDGFQAFLGQLDVLARDEIRPERAGEPESLLDLYLTHVADHHRNLPALFSTAHKDVALVHVELALEGARSAGPEAELRAAARLAHERTLRRMLELGPGDDLEVTRRWVVLGDPGAGKSTACRYLCHALATEARAEPDRALPIPVFVLASELAKHEIHPFALAEQQLGALLDAERVRGLGVRLHALAKNDARVWLFVDGLDELPREPREAVRARLLAWARETTPCVLVVTSRSAGFDPLAGFVPVRVKPLDSNGQRELLHNWLGPRAGEVWRELEHRPSLSALCSNPMLLSLVAYTRLHEEGEAAPPTTRRELYERAIDVLLAHGHGTGQGVASPFKCWQALPLLALELQREGDESWTRDDLLALLADLPRRYPERPELATYLVPWQGAEDRFLDDVAERSGLLAPLDGKHHPWRWIHRSVGEYLAAVGLERLGRDAYLELAKELKDAPRWGEVFGHLCGLATTPEEKLERLRALEAASPQIALRALPDVEDLGPAQAFEFLKEIDGGKAWDGDSLIAVTSRWLDRPLTRQLLLASLEPTDSLEHVAYVVYALEQLDIVLSVAELRVLISRRPGTQAPIEPDWRRVPPVGSRASTTFEFFLPESASQSAPGSTVGSSLSDSWQWRKRQITLAPFELANRPVLGIEYGRFDPSYGNYGADLPASGVSWWRAWLYCRWIGADLPTEAQWTYTCRFGTCTRIELEHRRNHYIADQSDNPFGIVDMEAYVWEWCRDGFGGHGRRVREEDGEQIVSGARRMFRAGSFPFEMRGARSAIFDGWGPSGRDCGISFRPARRVP